MSIQFGPSRMRPIDEEDGRKYPARPSEKKPRWWKMSDKRKAKRVFRAEDYGKGKRNG